MKRKIIFKVLLSLAVIMFIVSCGSNYDQDILGKWKDKNNSEIEFTTDGVIKGLARNVNQEQVNGTYKVSNDSLFIEFLVAPEPRNIKGSLEFKIQKLTSDSLVLFTTLGNLNYGRIVK